jgi:hypothetical protein
MNKIEQRIHHEVQLAIIIIILIISFGSAILFCFYSVNILYIIIILKIILFSTLV